MPSPFPGMDPYIESSGRWGDFYGSMIAAIRGQLNARLPEGYAANIDLELLSPGNKKMGEDREAYLAKRNECFESRVSLVEIDLLRGGRRVPLSNPPPEIGDYYILACRAWEYPRAAFWPFTIRSPLPEVPIPLTKGLPDVLLPLRPCMDRAYGEGRYPTRLPYGQPLKPRLPKADADWVRDLLTA